MKMPYKTEAEKAMEEYGKGLAKLNPLQLLLWAVFLCITTPFLDLYDYCRWKFCLEPVLDAETISSKQRSA